MLTNSGIGDKYKEAQIFEPYALNILALYNFDDVDAINLGISSLEPNIIRKNVEHFLNHHNIKTFLLSNTDVYLSQHYVHTADFEKLYEYMGNLQANFIIQTLGFTKKQIKDNIVEHPLLYPFNVKYQEIYTGKREHGFCFLNNLPKYFRLELGYALWKNDLLDDIIYTQNKKRSDVIVSDGLAETKLFKQFVKNLPFDHPFNKGIDIAHDHTVDHPAYKDSYANIFSESEIEYEVCTEKTFKPFVAGQIPIPLACKGYLNYMRKLGFHTFDDLLGIDYDYLDYSYKILRIVEIVKKGKNYIEDYYNSNIEHIKNNNNNIKKFIL